MMAVIKVRPMTSFRRFCDSRLFGIPLPLPDLCHHYLGAYGYWFFQNTFKGRSSHRHGSAITFFFNSPILYMFVHD
jgi:hypothetical protein